MKNYEQAFDDYLKGLKYKDIAKKYNVSLSAVKSWKSRYRNDMEVATKNGKVATKKKRESRDGGAPKQNKNAVTHGLFAKWLPTETAEIIETIQDRTEVDMFWDSIMFQYTAIIRAQKIMFVAC